MNIKETHICSVDDCTNIVVARGLCRKHYQRFYKYGDPLFVTPNTGRNNGNYKHGNYCEKSFCACGNTKDWRANKCAICSNRSFPVGAKYDNYMRVSEEDLLTTLNQSKHYSETAQNLNISRGGLMRKLRKMGNINTKHFIRSKGRPYSLEDIFIENSPATRYVIRRCILQHNLLEHVCAECGLGTIWDEKPLTLHLHHINGNEHDNRLENLTWLCPNCHSQTSTYTGRKRGLKDDQRKN